jgi:hypothetical protein
MTTFKTSIFAIAALAALTPVAAEAASRSLNLTPHDFGIQTGAAYATGVIELPNAGSPSVVANFVLPRDYKGDTDVRLRLVMFASSACTVRFGLSAASRSRSGSTLYNSTTEYAFANGNTAVSAGASITFTKTLIVKPAPGLGGQKPGDGIVVRIFRDATAINDTCDMVQIRHGEVRYTAK